MYTTPSLDIRTIDTYIQWLQAAARLSGKSPIATAMLLASKSRFERRSEMLTWIDGELESFGLTKAATTLGLRELEEAGLVEIEYDQWGRASAATLLSPNGLRRKLEADLRGAPIMPGH